jgi:hypothetical protein
MAEGAFWARLVRASRKTRRATRLFERAGLLFERASVVFERAGPGGQKPRSNGARQLLRGKFGNFKNSFNAYPASGCGSAEARKSGVGACEIEGCFVLAWSFCWTRSLRDRNSRDRLGKKSSREAVTTPFTRCRS